MDKIKVGRIAALNDEMRGNLGVKATFNGCAVMTTGISNLPDKDRASIITQIRSQSTFNEDNDPYGEHDFGKVTASWGKDVFWKINYYDLNRKFLSEDPSDPSQTMRVLTVMFAEEY